MRRADCLMWPGEAQRREERRAEARLANGIQRLDEAKRYHLNTLAREQAALHRHLITLKTGNRRRDFHVMASHPSNRLSKPVVSYNKTQLPTIPPANRHRSGNLQSICSLQARVQDFLSSCENRTGSASVPVYLPDLNPQPQTMVSAASLAGGNKEEDRDGQNMKNWGRGREGQKSPMEIQRFSSKEGQRENNKTVARYTNKEDETCVEIPFSTPLSSHSDIYAPDGQLRMVYTLPNFVQALAEARKARYIRHRGQPLCDRELSIPEIFASNCRDTHSTH